MTRYDTDWYAWVHEQAQCLEEGRWDALDVPHLVEELELMAEGAPGNSITASSSCSRICSNSPWPPRSCQGSMTVPSAAGTSPAGNSAGASHDCSTAIPGSRLPCPTGHPSLRGGKAPASPPFRYAKTSCRSPVPGRPMRCGRTTSGPTHPAPRLTPGHGQTVQS